MKIMVLGACGTFMAGMVVLAKQLGHTVVAYDQGCYPPMSTQLQAHDVILRHDDHLQLEGVALVVIGNGLSRQHPWVAQVLDANVPYTSGPQWLQENVLQGRHVIAVAGTHGKTTTSAMTTWILDQMGLKPGYLIGGCVSGLPSSAALGDLHAPFVIEADEYDSAFFDKRAKFLHYRPTTLVVGRLEHDHLDIYPTMQSMLQPFATLLQMVPNRGHIVHASQCDAFEAMLATHAHASHQAALAPGAPWQVSFDAPSGKSFHLFAKDTHQSFTVSWQSLFGQYNGWNGALAMLAAEQVGVTLAQSASVLSSFQGVAKRLQCWSDTPGVTVYEDFAHHPTAMALVIAALRHQHPKAKIKVLLQLGSFTQRSGLHWTEVGRVMQDVQGVWILRPADMDRDCDALLAQIGAHGHLFNDVGRMVQSVQTHLCADDVVVLMSSRDFMGLKPMLHDAIQARKLTVSS